MELIIINIEGDKYTLNTSQGKIVTLNLVFFDLLKDPAVGDIIKINEKFLDENFEEKDSIYRFGDVNAPFGREITKENFSDVITIKFRTGEEIYLKRFFG